MCILLSMKSTYFLNIFGCMIFFLTLVSSATIKVVWMAPKNTPPSSVIHVNASTSIGAFALAMETVYNEGMLPRNSFSVSYLDSRCDSKQSIGVFTEFLFNNHVDVVFGPPCTKAMTPIAELAAYRNIPVFGWLSNEDSLDNKTKLNTLVRTVSPLSSVGGIFSLFLLGFEWYRIVIISSAEIECRAYADAFVATFESYSFLGIIIARHFTRVDVDASDQTIANMLNAVKYEGRIVLLIVPESELRKYMVISTQLGMSSGAYQYLFVRTSMISDEEYNNVLSTDAMWRNGDENDASARQGFENLLYTTFGDDVFGGNSSSWHWESQTATQTLFGSDSRIPSWNEPDIYSPYLHDAVYLYAMVLQQYGGDPALVNGTTIATATHGKSFKGLSGDVVMTSSADRFPDITIYDLTETGNFSRVAYFRYAIVNNRIVTQSDIQTIRWGDGRTSNDYIPPDKPACGFYNENCQSSSTSQVALYIGLSLGMLIVALVIYILYRLWKKEADLKNMAWKIKYKDLDFSAGKQVRSFLNLSAEERSENNLHHRRASVLSKSDRGTEYTFGQTTAADSISEINRDPNKHNVTIARYRGRAVCIKYLNKRKVKVDRKLLKELKQMMDLKHANVAVLMGLCTDTENNCSLWEYCSKGSLRDIIENEDIKLDAMFKLSIAVDICKGLEYIQKSELRFHGNLKSSNCLIDSRWTCKVTDFGPRHIRGEQIISKPEEEDEIEKYSALFWMAPELLRKVLPSGKRYGSPAGDVYAFAVIAKEIICRDAPYPIEGDWTPKDIIINVMNNSGQKPFRPKFPAVVDGLQTLQQGYAIQRLIQTCWVEDPMLRPTLKTVLKSLNKISPFKKSNVIENMVVMMEKYSNQLEDLVSERTGQLQEEKRKTDALLYRMLPQKVAEELKLGRAVEAETFHCVTIYFSDIVGFTSLAGESTPMQVVNLLNSLYTLFDDIIGNYDVYKVETIGDAYMIVSGLPERNGDRHVTEMAAVSIELLEGVKRFEVPHETNKRLQIRIGLHSGSVVAGVVGLTMPRYCLFGDTVNTASRMESNGKALMIHVSENTHKLLKQQGGYILEERGKMEIKGKGQMTTYWLKEKVTSDRPLTPGNISMSHLPLEEKTSGEEENDGDDVDKSKAMNYVSFFKRTHLPRANDIWDKETAISQLFEDDDDV